MKSNERIACIRIFSDLIMADTVIDAGEMQYFDELRSVLKFTRQDEIDASAMTLSEAVEIMREADAETRGELLRRCRELSLSDGFCARSEALLIMAVTKALDSFWGEVSHVYSFPKQMFNIPTSCIFYIEGQPTEYIDSIVERNYRALFSEFRLAGFEFIYIPHVVGHYRDAEPGLMDSIVGFVAPKLSEEGRHASVEKLLKMTTAEFTKDILCNKLGMEALRGTTPALFLKTGISYVGDTVYSNYLKMDIEGDLLKDVHNFLDEFTSMLSSDVVIMSNNKEHRNQFLYTGFYKLLMDTHLMRRHVRSRVFINPFKEEIFFPDIDTVLRGLHRREKALYLTLLVLSGEGGVNFSSPDGARQIAAWNKRMARVQELYCRIYGLFGGDSDKAPDLTQSDIRRPMLSLIKRHVGKLADQLHDVGDYMVSRDDDGNMAVHLSPDLVMVRDTATGEMTPLALWAASLATLQG